MITPSPGFTSYVAVGGTPVDAACQFPAAGSITNPLSAADQGVPVAEPLYVNPTGAATLSGNDGTFALQPGESWNLIPGQSTVTSVNAATSGHRFVAVVYKNGMTAGNC